jgi:hypothetical protein
MLIRSLNKTIVTECYYETDREAFRECRLKSFPEITHLIEKSYAQAVIFKPICDSQNAEEILKTYPRGRGLWIFRGYHDVINSGLKRFRYHKERIYRILYKPESAGWLSENIEDEKMALLRYYYERGVSDASARALLWYITNYHFFRQELHKHKRVLLINYEKVVIDPSVEFQKIADFLDIEFGNKMIEGISTRSIKKDAPPHIDPEIETLCASLLSGLHECMNQQENFGRSSERVQVPTKVKGR